MILFTFFYIFHSSLFLIQLSAIANRQHKFQCQCEKSEEKTIGLFFRLQKNRQKQQLKLWENHGNLHFNYWFMCATTTWNNHIRARLSHCFQTFLMSLIRYRWNLHWPKSIQVWKKLYLHLPWCFLMNLLILFFFFFFFFAGEFKFLF